MPALILDGNCIDMMRSLPAESVDVCCTSIPYYGLRSYGTEPQIWGGDQNCDHEWADPQTGRVTGGNDRPPDNKWKNAGSPDSPSIRYTCQVCGAWRGELGLEPTVELFVEHVVMVFREVWRLLVPTGTLWLNVGDSYNAFNGNRGAATGANKRHHEIMPDLPAGHGLSVKTLKPKDMLMVPARVALALQADGWYLRSEITWAKKAPMPESVEDRPTKATERIYLLSKSQRYYYDRYAVAERSMDDALRNMWDYWLLGPEPTSAQHYAAFPTEIPRRAIRAGSSARGRCPVCKKPWTRCIRKPNMAERPTRSKASKMETAEVHISNNWAGYAKSAGQAYQDWRRANPNLTIGWQPSCKCDAGYEPSVVLDPFAGTGTTGAVAVEQGRDAILIDLQPKYTAIARRRLAGVQPMMLNPDLHVAAHGEQIGKAAAVQSTMFDIVSR